MKASITGKTYQEFNIGIYAVWFDLYMPNWKCYLQIKIPCPEATVEAVCTSQSADCLNSILRHLRQIYQEQLAQNGIHNL